MELETALLRCSSCGARCEPTRSFCKRCGSAVFVDDSVYSRLSQISDLEHGGSQVGAAVGAASGGPGALPTPQVVRRAVRRGTMQPAPAAVVANAGCLGSLVRWAVFVGIAYYALNAFGLWPDLRNAAGALMRGDQTELTGLVDRLRGVAGSTGETSPDGVPAAAAADEPLITPPRVTSRVAARYPSEAFARGIQGTVVLRVTVEPDGAVSNVEVLRSVDTQYGIDDAAVAAVRGWTFEPGRQGDERVRLATTVSVRFATAPPSGTATGSAPAAR